MFSLFFDNILGLNKHGPIEIFGLNIEIMVRQFALHLTKESDVCIDQTPSLKAGINQN